MEQNPFVAYRHHLDLYHRAMEAGLEDAAYVDVVNEADERVAKVQGVGFRVTPVVELKPAEVWPGWPIQRDVWAKVETANVGGSHKARHLFGLALIGLIDAALGLGEGTADADLAIASCGNAALGAAVVAAGLDRSLQVFVPTDADQEVLDQLDALGAKVNICHRQSGVDGDPCIVGLDAAVQAGAVPFTVQGPRCPDVIDGGRTIGLELADQLDRAGVDPTDIYIQIGGGALASATMDGLARAWPDRRLPRLHPVQAVNAHPYIAGWERMQATIGDKASDAIANGGQELKALLAENADVMTPWPTPPHSIASGILDDVTYDWPGVMYHQLTTGGWPIAVDEATFVIATDIAAPLVSPQPDATGAAGLAGLLQATSDQLQGSETEAGPAVVLLTGIDRSQ